MENIALPSKIEVRPTDKKNEAVVSIQPCHPGYGTTLGNALRRVLLSSLPGAAVTAFKIKGASHEFSSIDNIKEDLVEISLNLKQLRLKVFSEEPVRLELKVKGEKKVTAKDIKTTSDAEIVSSDLLIATLTSKDAELDMEIIVSQGRGYVPTESVEKENTEADLILIDSIFTPLKNVGITIENIRVGQMTNYENLLLTIETDGSITPQEALVKANQILIDHFNFVDQQSQAPEAKKTTRKKTSEPKEKKLPVEKKIEEEAEEEIKKKAEDKKPARKVALSAPDEEEKEKKPDSPAKSKQAAKKKAEKATS